MKINYNAIGVCVIKLRKVQIFSDSVAATTSVFREEIEKILCDCSNIELGAMIDTMNLVNSSMRVAQNNNREY